MTRIPPLLAITAAALSAQPAASTPTIADKYKLGHSHLGETFDTGPRQKPWIIPNIGKAHFPISHKNPEVQQWFDQGITLLRSFWDYEAERSFRWTLKLEPENAMAWWGLSRATSDKRSAEFLREASKRKHGVTERERLYIEASESLLAREALRDRGGIAYVIAFAILANYWLPPTLAALASLAFTSTIEFLQLWHPPVLEALRHTLPGRLILGTTFHWSDFPPYGIGALLARTILKRIGTPAPASFPR